MDVRFVIVAPAKSRKTFKVRLPCDVGRDDEATFRIRQDSVSRRHCAFKVEGGAVVVIDLGSTNGTFVGGSRLEPHTPTPVSSGAEVRIGAIVLRIEYAASADAAPRATTDTVSLPAAAQPEAAASAEFPELEPVAEEVPELEPVATAAAACEPTAGVPQAMPACADVEPAAPAAGAQAFPDAEPAAAPTDFAALAGVEPAAPPAEGSFDFLAAEAAPPPAADDRLDDFFKSLS